MKKLQLLLLVVLLPFSGIFGQMSILLVDDTDDSFLHAEIFAAALDSLGYNYTLFDAAGTGTVPSIFDYAGVDLVIWHAGSDGDSLAFWSRMDTTNPDLESYLAGGGNLWVMGTDLLYDKYFGAPVTFSAGSFAYDYMGLASYDVQSYVDDGSQGLPFADPAPNAPISGLPQLDWIFSTLWYVDGVTGVAGAEPVYMMGDTGYVMAGRTCGLYYDNGTSKALSFFFNASQILTAQKLQAMTDTILNFFSSQLVGTPEATLQGTLNVYPNPGSDRLNLQYTVLYSGTAQVEVYSAVGAKVYTTEMNLNVGVNEVRIPASELQPGVYIIKVNEGHQAVQKMWVKQ